jgi:hypothetical protein
LVVYQYAFWLPYYYTISHLIWNLQYTYKNPFQFISILKKSLFSKSSLSLHATELVQKTMKLFLSLQGGGIW